MTMASVCKNPVAIEQLQKLEERLPTTILSGLKPKVEQMNQVKPYILDFESNNICAGSCAYCYSSSTNATTGMHTRERVLELIDEVYALGVRTMSWGGGDPLAHPNWAEFIQYAGEKGITNYLSTAGLISKAQAKQISELADYFDSVGVHIDTINQEAYNRSHNDPKTLGLKVQGWRNLLEAGLPKDRINGCITPTRPSAETIEETIDWMLDEMGTTNIMLVHYKPEGFGKARPDLEPSLSLTRKALEYRIKRMGEKWLHIGSSDAGKFICRTIFGILWNGDVVPCVTMRVPVGNIYQEKLAAIMERDRDTLLYNYDIEGPCGNECEYSDICFGCRVTAYHFTGNVKASDPKCFMNTEAKEYYLSGN